METVKLLGFDVNVTMYYSKKTIDISNNVTSISISLGGNKLIPKLYIKYGIDSSMMDQLQIPHKLIVKIVEKNVQNDPRTVIPETEWVNVTYNTKRTRREETAVDRLDFVEIESVFVLYSSFILSNSSVYGLYSNKKISIILNDLWNQTAHGKLKLNMETIDNIFVYPQILIPPMKFNQALHLISKKGTFDDIPIIYSDLFEFNITCVSKLIQKYKPINLLITGGDTTKTADINNREYSLMSFPQIQSNIHSLISMFPKKINILMKKRNQFKDFKTTINTIDLIKSMSHVDCIDIFNDNLEVLMKPEMTISLNDDEFISFKESIYTVLGKAIDNVKIKIPAPFRLNHWNIGNPVNVKSSIYAYKGLDIKMYITELSIVLNNTDNKIWGGYIDATLSTASTRNIIF